MSSNESLDDFLSYSNRGTQTNYLSKWKEDGSVVVWLHKQLAPKRLWRHALKRIVTLKDKQTQEEKVSIWSDKYVCLESEDLLKDQNRFVRLTGQRQRPPHVCPTCLFAEYIRSQILTGKLNWLAPILKYTTDSEEEVVRAQGLLGYPKSDKLSDVQRKDLRDHDVDMRESWKEDGRAKMNWIFVCAEHKHPEQGIKVAIESQLLGDKVRGEIKKAMEKAELTSPGAGSKGNPLVNPYPIKFVFNAAKDIPFGEKYDAVAFESIAPSPEILALIDSEPPREQVEGLLRHPDLAALRANLEEHCLIKNVPWDEIFAPAYALYKTNDWKIAAEKAPEAPAKEESVSEKPFTTIVEPPTKAETKASVTIEMDDLFPGSVAETEDELPF